MLKLLTIKYLSSLFGAILGFAFSMCLGPFVLKSPNMTSIGLLVFFVVHAGACTGVYVTEIHQVFMSLKYIEIRRDFPFLKYFTVLVGGTLIAYFVLFALGYFFGDAVIFVYFFFIPIIFLAFNGLFDAGKNFWKKQRRAASR